MKKYLGYVLRKHWDLPIDAFAKKVTKIVDHLFN
jgi:hypothetical protein